MTMTHPHEGPQVRARSGSDLMTKARNLLADQYEANGSKEFAVEIRTGNLNRVGMGCAISAIVKALALPHQSAPAEPALMYMLNLFAADRYPSALTMHEMTKEFLSTLPQQAATDEGDACPFCGCADTFVERSDFSSSYVVCNNCSARGPVECQEDDDEDQPGKDAAIRSWSKRSPFEALAQIEHARSVLVARHLAKVALTGLKGISND